MPSRFPANPNWSLQLNMQIDILPYFWTPPMLGRTPWSVRIADVATMKNRLSKRVKTTLEIFICNCELEQQVHYSFESKDCGQQVNLIF
jgi:hypothetical protein